ncbi:membrane protein [Cellulomonas soli]|uniref:Membrane protein n=2 Tax=Cellulomonas soli TaxID=931535 RepID=A0A512P9U7_9CELL|nr:membrane protein [Cellulomonas soli]
MLGSMSDQPSSPAAAPGDPTDPAATADGSAPDAPHGFDERLWPGPLGWALTALFGLVLGVILVPVSVPLATAVAVVGLAGALTAMASATPRVALVDGHLLAGRARIPVGLLGEVAPLDRAGVRTAMGPGLDARAYVCLRAWIPSGVRIEVIDPQDPTPYWIVSTRHPERLRSALRAAQTTTSLP